MKLSLRSYVACGGLIISASFSSMTVSAQEISVMGPPTVSYEAQRSIITQDVSLIQSVHSKPGKNRSEMSISGQEVIQIWRDDLSMVYSLSPQQGVAMAIPYGSDKLDTTIAGFDRDTAVLEKRYIGKETVNGVSANHYYIKASSSGGGTAMGDVWTTPENITVRMRMKVKTPGDPQQDVSLDLIGLRITHQPDVLFEVPDGYQVMDASGMEGSIMGSVSGYAGDVANEAGNSAVREADRRVRNKANQEAAKAVRKILKW